MVACLTRPSRGGEGVQAGQFFFIAAGCSSFANRYRAVFMGMPVFFTIFRHMKRILLHVFFWGAYALQGAVLETIWLSPSLPKFTEQQRIWAGIHTTLAMLIPKLLFTYFVLYVSIPQMLREQGRLRQIIAGIIAMWMASMLLYRIIFEYYINPIVTDNVFPERSMIHINRLLLALMDIGFVSGTAIALKLFRTQLAAKEREKNLTKEKLQTELKFLRNQTNPHFLFNTLNNIYALARKKSDDTPDVVMKLSKLLRFMLYESKKDLVSISEEIRLLDDYLELEKIRYNERLSIHFQKEIDDDEQQIAPLLLLPFIENAFKHGVSETRFDSFIHITLRLQEGQLQLEVRNTKEDNGQDTVNENIGLGNVRRQLELMYKEYNLQISNQPAVFTVYLTINLNSHAKIQLYHSGR